MPDEAKPADETTEPTDKTAEPADKTAELSNEELDTVSGGLKHSGGTTEHDEKPLQLPPDVEGRPMGTAIGRGGGAFGI